MTDSKRWQAGMRERIDQALDDTLGPELGESRLREAARYSVLSSGKRLRPLLVYASAAAVGAAPGEADAAAVAVELLHAYSLIHDDLPAMDDDALRRGQPTCHVVFGEAIAILAGDALQALAFQRLVQDDGRSAEVRLQQAQLLARAVGFQGMALGQAMDLEAEGKPPALDALMAMHRKKTGALITASILMGAASGAASSTDWHALEAAGQAIGLAFQIQDDILDETQHTEVLGKQRGRDQTLNKATFPKLMGLDDSQTLARRLVNEAIDSLDQLSGQTEHLKYLAIQAVERSH